jgi:hypothetical protein
MENVFGGACYPVEMLNLATIEKKSVFLSLSVCLERSLLEIEPRASCMLSVHSTIEHHI